MNKNNLIAFCLKCGGHYKQDEIYQVKVVTKDAMPPANLYICKGCYEALPETDEIRKMVVVK